LLWRGEDPRGEDRDIVSAARVHATAGNIFMPKSIAKRVGIAALVLLGSLAWGAAAAPAAIVYATASESGLSNSIFGTLNLTTGQFTETAALPFTASGLAAGPGGTLLATDFSQGGIKEVTTAGATSTFGTTTKVYIGLAPTAGGSGYLDETYLSKLNGLAANGTGETAIGTLHDGGTNVDGYGSGALALGPDGDLYATGGTNPLSSPDGLYRVDPATADATQLNADLGVGEDSFVIGSAGGVLYGIDGGPAVDLGIYTVDLDTGDTTQVATVTGLPRGYTIDSFASASVPEPTTAAALLAACGVGGLRRGRRRRRSDSGSHHDQVVTQGGHRS
jgi:hypothetical protein